MMRRSHAAFFLAFTAACGACGTKDEDLTKRDDVVTVLRFTPTGYVDSTRPIQIEFSKPLVAKPEDEARELVVLAPRIAVSAHWIQPDVLELLPKGQFQQSTRYRATLRPEVAGEKLKLLGQTDFEFNTKMFELLSVEPFFETKEALKVRVNLEFSYPVRPADVKSAVSFVDKDQKAIGAKLSSSENGPVMAFELEPLPLSTEDRTIEVRISGTLGAIGGGEPLGKDIVRPIALGKPEKLVVYEVSAVQNGEKYQ